jgi:hypothetical protein
MQKYVNGILTDMTAEEIAARQAEEAAWAAGANDRAAADNREKRNQLIAETDYFALTDVALTAEMTTYRQALRDITSHANWPNLSDSDWPSKPTE